MIFRWVIMKQAVLTILKAGYYSNVNTRLVQQINPPRELSYVELVWQKKSPRAYIFLKKKLFFSKIGRLENLTISCMDSQKYLVNFVFFWVGKIQTGPCYREKLYTFACNCFFQKCLFERESDIVTKIEEKKCLLRKFFSAF